MDVSSWELSRFAAGCFGIFLASPVLSLVDSGFVGRCSGTAQLAALGPGTSLSDSTLYVLSGVGVATTNLYASQRARRQLFGARRVASDALALGLLCGAALGLAQVAIGPWAIGRVELSADVAQHALAYVRIRAVGSPVALLTTTAQATCLGDRDSLTPVLVVIISGLANVIGDALLVPDYGIVGAAVATIVAQAIGAVFLLAVLRRRQLKMSKTGYQPFGVTFSEPGPLVTMPTRKAAGRFFAIAIPVVMALLGKVLFINSLTVAAAAAGTVALAAHQVAVNQFFLFCKAGDSLGAAAQAYLPAAQVLRDRQPVRQLILRIARLSVVWGIINAGLAALLPLLAAGLFTRDLAVQSAIRSVAPLLGGGLLLHCTTLALEGVLLASNRGRWLAGVYWINSFIFIGGLFQGMRTGAGLLVVWAAMVLFQVVRLSEFASRVWLDQWKAKGIHRTEGKQASVHQEG